MNNCAAFIGEFDATFPDLRGLPKGADRIPGRDVAEMVLRGLRGRGFEVSDVQNSEPFFEMTCRFGNVEFQILIVNAGPPEKGRAAIWSMTCAAVVAAGFFGRRKGVENSEEEGRVLDALHEILRSETRVKEVRWFRDPDVEPFSEGEYAISPRAEIRGQGWR